MTKYIVVYNGPEGLEQVYGTKEYDAPCWAQSKMIKLEKNMANL